MFFVSYLDGCYDIRDVHLKVHVLLECYATSSPGWHLICVFSVDGLNSVVLVYMLPIRHSHFCSAE